MKISNYMNNTNLIMGKSDAKVQKENKQVNEKHTGYVFDCFATKKW